MAVSNSISRRQALVALGGLVPTALLAQDEAPQGEDPRGEVAELRYKAQAGVLHDRITDWDNDPFVISVERRLRCMCGCNQNIYQCRTTDFTCPLWPQTHPQIIAMAQEGKTAQEIIDVFVAEHGNEVLMAPPASGFNLTAYWLPGAVISSVAAAIIWVMVRRSQVAQPAAVEARDESLPSGVTERDEELLREELEKLEL